MAAIVWSTMKHKNKDESCSIMLRKNQQWLDDRNILECLTMKTLQRVKGIHLCKPSFFVLFHIIFCKLWYQIPS